jgi:protein involved in polysaccharide export with SLBB domain
MHRFALLLVSLVVLASRLSAQQPPMPAPATASASANVELRVGDVLRVAVWREPTLSGDFPVDQDGYITLPLLGIRQAQGVPWLVLRDSLLAGYRRELRTETISLVPLRRIYVLGSVLRPGLYMLDPTLGLEGAVALAGGAGLDGNLDRIRVMRDGKVLLDRIPIKATPQQYDVRSGDQLFVERRSWLDRNSTLLLTSVISLAGIVVSLASRK